MEKRGLPESERLGRVKYWEKVRDDAMQWVDYADMQLDLLHNVGINTGAIAVQQALEIEEKS